MTRQTTKYPEIAKTAGTVMAAETPFTAANKTLIDALRRICGDAHVLTHQDPSADLSPWEQDWRKRVKGRALAVVRPGSTLEVAAVVKACAAVNTPIVLAFKLC